MLSTILTHVIEITAAVLSVLLVELARRAISYFAQKTKVEIPAKLEQTILEIAEHSVNFAAEKAHQHLKENGEKLSSGRKLDMALEFGMTLVDYYKLEEVAKEKMTKYIETKLGATRALPEKVS